MSKIYRKDATGAGQEERLTEGPNQKILLDWSKDGKYLLYREVNPGTGRDLMALPLQGDKKPIAMVNTPFDESTGAISPDGGGWPSPPTTPGITNSTFRPFRAARETLRIGSNILGVLIVLVGTIWFLQGIRVLPGSFITGQIQWAIYGSIVVVAGGFLLLRINRRREGPRPARRYRR